MILSEVYNLYFLINATNYYLWLDIDREKSKNLNPVRS